MFKQIFSLGLAVTAMLALSTTEVRAEALFTSTQSNANLQYPNDCRWDPQGSSICRGRNFCFMSPNHPKCRLYCSYYPYDRVCNRW